jgi:hypothetical protein
MNAESAHDIGPVYAHRVVTEIELARDLCSIFRLRSIAGSQAPAESVRSLARLLPRSARIFVERTEVHPRQLA